MLLAVHGLVLAAAGGAEKAMIADLVPPERLGTGYGWFHLVSGLMLVPASVGFGWLWHAFGAPTAFAASAMLAAAAGLALLGFGRQRERDGCSPSG